LEKYTIPVEDVLHTYALHIAEMISSTINENQVKKLLITGGGAYNHFLIEKIKEKTKAEIIIPDDATIQYKEALIFAFLGVLKWRSEVNVLSSVTGAKHDHSSGVIFRS
jgi:anhydro-N-acetylmuramic acid kinase